MIHRFHGTLDNSLNFPCGICNENIGSNQKALRCSLCNYMLHIKCNKTDNTVFKNLFFCRKCQEDIIPFQKLSANSFTWFLRRVLIKTLISPIYFLSLNSSLKTYFNDINNFNDNANDIGHEAPSINCNYVNISSFDHKNKKDILSLFHLNIASLSKHKEEHETILNIIDLKFDIVGITETKLKSHIDPSLI